MFNKDFYPTPPDLIDKMLSKVEWGKVTYILEPSAGKGDIVEAINKRRRDYAKNIDAIEIEEELQAILRSKKINVIDSDFLQYNSLSSYDLIIANPPFSEGDKHLLKMIDLMRDGQIVCLLNAETLKNACTNIRKDLKRKLEDLGANIEYIQGAFKDGERKTGVEIAIVYIKMESKRDKNILEEINLDEAKEYVENDNSQKENKELITNRLEAILIRYNETVKSGIEVIEKYRKNSKYLKGLIELNNCSIRDLYKNTREKFWKETFELPEFKELLTQKKLDEYKLYFNDICKMEFNERNIYNFLASLKLNFKKTLEDNVTEIFELLTKYSFNKNNEYEKNIHYYDGWVTNKCYKVNKRVIFPMSIYDYSFGLWVSWDKKMILNDVDKVMSYFDSMNKDYIQIADVVESSIKKNITGKWEESTYFKVKIFKKGTIHLEFKNEDLLRRFNIMAGQLKNWLPPSYSKKDYKDMNTEEKRAVEDFEGIKNYKTYKNDLFMSMKLLA